MARTGGYTDDDERQAAAAVAACTAAVHAAIAAIPAVSDPQHAFELATQLVKELRRLIGEVADLRAQQVQRIWDAEELSLAELGKRIGGVSKQRAGKLLQDASRDREEKGDG